MRNLRLERIGLDRLPGVNRFFLELSRRPDLRSRFLGVPAWDLAGLRDRAAAVRRPVRALAELVRQNEGAGHAAAHALEAAARPGAVFVVTGQQAGLFGGPAYTVFKALTVVRLVRALRAEGIDAVGVFWVASEDHDIAEICGTTVFAPGTGLHRLELPVDMEIPWPVAQRRLDAAMEDLLERTVELLPAGTHAEAIQAWLRECYRPGAGWGDAFRGFMQRLFAPLGLLLFDPMAMDRHRPLREFLDCFPAARPGLIESVRKATAEIRGAGFDPQVELQPERSFLFYLHPEAGRRRVLETESGRFAVDGTEMAWSLAEWPEVLDAHAEAFSPDALLRPLFQDWLFPTVVYVGGPAEIAYQAQIRELYAAWEMTPPLLWPRAGATLVTPGAARRADQLGLAPADILLRRDEDLLSAVLSAQGRLQPLERFRAARPAAEAGLEELTGSLVGAPDDVLRFAESTRGKLRGLLDKLDEHAHRRLKNEQDDSRRRFESLSQELLPDGNLQERTLNLLPLLQAYGPELLAGLADVLDPFVREHFLIHMEERA
jgi:bacillithiol biosynthesis cysteine-adding enzyme BshC